LNIERVVAEWYCFDDVGKLEDDAFDSLIKRLEEEYEKSAVIYIVNEFARLNIDELNKRIDKVRKELIRERKSVFDLNKSKICEFYCWSGELNAYCTIKEMLKDISKYKDYIIDD